MKDLKTLKEKQLTRIQLYISKFHQEIKSTEPNITLLGKYVRNIRNYTYTHHLTIEVTQQINECMTKFSDFKTNKKEENINMINKKDLK